MIKFIKNLIANIKLTSALKRQKIAREIASKRAKEAYWNSQRKVWGNDTHKRMKAGL